MTKKKEKQTMKTALYESEYGSMGVHEVMDWMEDGDTYVRSSNVVEVEFIKKDEAIVIAGRVKCFDKKIKDKQAEAQVEIDRLKQQRQDLLALPNL